MNSKFWWRAFWVGGVLVLTGCASIFGGREFVVQESAEETILAGAADFERIDDPVSVDCDGVEDIPFEVGSTFTCTGVAENGDGFVVEGTLTDTEEGRFEYELAEIVDADGTSRDAGFVRQEPVEETILAGLADFESVDDPVSVDCAGVEELPLVVGETHICTGVDQNGNEFEILVELTTDDGKFEYSVAR